jgi:uncharacterized membrane protein YgaE (UPF0421/DUF939 family)
MDNRTEKAKEIKEGKELEMASNKNAKAARAEARRREKEIVKIKNRRYSYSEVETLLRRKENQMTNAVMDLVKQIEKFGYEVSNENGAFQVVPANVEVVSEGEE